MTAARLAFALTGAGSLAVVAGVALVYLPAAIILSGAALVATGLLGIDIGGKE